MVRRPAAIALLLAAGCLLFSATWTSAQVDVSTVPPGPRRVDLSAAGGFRFSTDWSDLVLIGTTSPVGGIPEQVLTRDLMVEPGAAFNVAVTYWEGRYGFRTHLGFGRSCLAVGRSCGELARLVDAPAETVRVDTWTYDIGGAIGLLEYRRDTWVWPYVFVGVGGVTYDLERTIQPPLTLVDGRPVTSVASPIVIGRDPDPLLIVIDELGLQTRLAFNVGIGSDVRVPIGGAALGLRFEVSDHVHRSPVGIEILRIDRFGARQPTRVDFGLVHNLRAAAGIVLQLGR